MTALFLIAGAAIWFGILTSISPCPLATNIAAISYVSRRVSHPGRVILSGILYTAGRMTAYILIGTLIVSGALAVPNVASALQKHMNAVLGPVLILTGILILGFIPLPSSGWKFIEKLQAKADKWGEFGAFVLGFLFALSFCPVSAGLFFGSLIPLAITQSSRFFLPSLYGIGTALPVFIFAGVITYSAKSVGMIFNKATHLEKWARWGTVIIFFSVGVYFTLAYTVKPGG
jgi:cytochrome c-type biogenesis protein